ncbi:MOXD1 like protein 2 [Habropoda laboriosa]|uniref:MOXD1 like protein 2 n=1 Tax=Habropoda laboriosa TaxID=597456 RepID=A0A0L7QZI1_9HYME|nr:MOXD1 like protein 2 [Habropoda laboriosa]
MKAAIASCLLLFVTGVLSVEWKYSAILDNNFLVLWTPGETDIMFEIQVKTRGYVGLGFTREDSSVGADMIIGWVDNNGQLHLQRRSSFLFSYKPPQCTKLSTNLSKKERNLHVYTYVRKRKSRWVVRLQIASVSRVRNFSGRIVARSFHNACRAAQCSMRCSRRRTFSYRARRQERKRKRKERRERWREPAKGRHRARRTLHVCVCYTERKREDKGERNLTANRSEKVFRYPKRSRPARDDLDTLLALDFLVLVDARFDPLPFFRSNNPILLSAWFNLPTLQRLLIIKVNEPNFPTVSVCVSVCVW